MKRRIVTIAVSFLLCIGMIGAGFAAWVITGNTQATETGAIEVQEVNDHRLNVTVAWKDVSSEVEDSKIIFGNHATDTCSWLANDGANEKLSATLLITVNNHKALLDAGLTYGFSFNLVETGATESTGYAKAAAANLVGALPTIEAISANAATTESYTYEVVINFTWGSAFGNVNPLTYYKNTDYSDATANTAKTNLENLNMYLQGIGYSLTLTGTVS